MTDSAPDVTYDDHEGRLSSARRLRSERPERVNGDCPVAAAVAGQDHCPPMLTGIRTRSRLTGLHELMLTRTR